MPRASPADHGDCSRPHERSRICNRTVTLLVVDHHEAAAAAAEAGHADMVCPKQAHAGSLGTRSPPFCVLHPQQPSKVKSAVAASTRCGTPTEADVASFDDLCIKPETDLALNVGAQTTLVPTHQFPTNRIALYQRSLEILQYLRCSGPLSAED